MLGRCRINTYIVAILNTICKTLVLLEVNLRNFLKMQLAGDKNYLFSTITIKIKNLNLI